MKISKNEKRKTNYLDDIAGARPAKEYVRGTKHDQMDVKSFV